MALSTPTQEMRLPSGRRPGTARAHQTNSQPELDDHYLVALAKEGRTDAYDAIVRRYRGFVRLKASSYFLLGGESDDLIQEGLLGLYKAIRDYRTDRESSFRNFAELCITRQIITAVKTATRNKHTPAQPVRLLQPDAGRGGRLGNDPGRDPARADGPRPGQPGDRHRRAGEPRLLPLGRLRRPLRPREPRPLALPRRPLLRGRSPSASSATRRPSTTPCSGSSARSAPTSPPVRCRSRRQIGEDVVEQLAAVVGGDGDVVGLDSDPVQRLHPQHVAVGAAVGEDARRRRRRAARGGRRPAPSPASPAAGRRRRRRGRRGGRGGGARRRSPSRGRRPGTWTVISARLWSASTSTCSSVRSASSASAGGSASVPRSSHSSSVRPTISRWRSGA